MHEVLAKCASVTTLELQAADGSLGFLIKVLLSFMSQGHLRNLEFHGVTLEGMEKNDGHVGAEQTTKTTATLRSRQRRRSNS